MRLFNPLSILAGRGTSPARAATSAVTLLVAGALAMTLLPRHGYACSTVPDRYGGLLGALREVQSAPPVPRNAAFLWSAPINAPLPADPVMVAYDVEAHAPILARVERRIAKMTFATPKPSTLYIAKTAEPLPSHLTLALGTASGLKVTTGDYIDDQPPSAPRVVSGALTHSDGGSTACSQSSCGDSDSLDLSIVGPSSDDHAAAELVTYAVYLEKSADEARTTATPFVLLQAPPSPSAGGYGLHVSVDASWTDSDAYIAVSALDLAGNESARSEPFQVNASGVGCAVQTRRRHPPFVSMTLAATAVLAWARRRTRRR